MHERGVVADVVREAERLCESQPGTPVRVRLTIGALSGLSATSVDHYFRQLTGPDSPLKGVDLDVSASEDLDPVLASTLSIDTIEFRGS